MQPGLVLIHDLCMQSSSSPGSDTADTVSVSEESAGHRFFSRRILHSRQSSASSFSKQPPESHRRFSLIPDFATLIRSHSTSSRIRKSALQTRSPGPDITSRAFFSGYADHHPQSVHPIPATSNQDMLSSNERPSRKLKSENRLYNFLTRSRSRSRSKNDTPESTMPELPSKPRSHRTTTDSPGSKPASRIQSRPLSSTTTATNTTITPATPKARKQAPANSSPNAIILNSPQQPAPTTPKPSSGSASARQKLHDFFSIPLGRKSSRSRSRSRPNSPRPSLDVPPLPNAGVDDDPTPRPRRSANYAPHLPRRSPSPTPEPKVLRVTNATTTSSSTGSTAASVKISKFFSTKAPEPMSFGSGSGPPVLPPIPSIVPVSAPLSIKRVTSLHRRTPKDNLEPPSNNSTPKNTHAPPTPLKHHTSSSSNSKGSGTGSGSGGSGSGQPPSSSSSRMVYHSAKGSLDSSMYKYRGATMGVVDEEGANARAPSASGKGKAREATSSHGHERSSSVLPRPGHKSQMSSAVRATKHGSFDFERPGWGAPVIQRSGSNGTTGTGASSGAWSKVSDLNARERERENMILSGYGKDPRESVDGPGLAGVGTLQREASMKRGQEREEISKTRRDRKDRDKEKEKGKPAERERPSTSQRTTPGSSTTPSGNNSDQHASNGKTSSMSKATSRRDMFNLGGEKDRTRKSVSGTGVTRLIGFQAHHPPFSFEPPVVPSPTRSTGSASTGTAHEVPLSTGKREREQERVREEKERLTSRRVKTKTKGDRAPVPVPAVTVGVGVNLNSLNYNGNRNAGHRSGTKGRSLDLGLGLAWAPSKVREEALLPASGFFSRTMSGSSAHGQGHQMSRTASGSTSTGRSASGQSKQSGFSAVGSGREEERSKLGKEVAEVFRNALDPEGYKLFRAYVHQFDADEIPFDGPTGIVSRVERLLVSAPHLGEEGKKRLLDSFVRIILAQA